MATYKDTALALPNLVALWMMTDADNSTSAVDSGPNNLPLTYNVAKTSGVENVLGAGAGMAASTSLYATRAVAAGSPLDFVGSGSISTWVTPTLATAGIIIAGRTNHMRMALNTGISLGVIGWNPAVIDSRTGAFYSINNPYHVVVTYNATMFRTYVNGKLLQETVAPGALPSSSGTFQVGQTNAAFTGTISGVAVYSRALTGAEVDSLYRAGTTKTPVGDGLVTDNLYDSLLPVIASAAAGSKCAVCQGARRVNEPVINSGLAFFHQACYAARGSGKTITIPSASSIISDYEGPALRLLHLVMHSLSVRCTDSSRITYYDGSRLQSVTDIRTGGFDVLMPWMSTMAIVARHTGLPKQHWMISMLTQQIEFLWTLQQTDGTLQQPPDIFVGTPTKVGSDFVTGPLGEAILYMRPYVTATVWNRWVTNFLAVGDALYDTKGNTVISESNFYVNGNREAGELWGLYMMYLLSGKQAKWLTRYNDQYTYLTTYESKLHAGLNGSTYGFVTVVDDTVNADGRNGKGYLIERTSGKTGHIVGPDSTAILDGYDPNYVSLCNQFLTRLYIHSQDARILRIINMQYNMNIDRVNMTGAPITSTLAAAVAVGATSFTLNTKPSLIGGYFNVDGELISVATITGTQAPYTAVITDGKPAFTAAHASGATVTRDGGLWSLDGRGGARQDNPSSFGVPLPFFLGMNQGYSRVTPAQVAACFAELIRFEQNDTLNASFVNRDVNSLASWLMCLPNWPGDPTV